MNYKKRITLFMVLSFFVFSGFAQDKISDKKIAFEVDKYLAELAHKNFFGGTVLIARNNRIILNKGFGMANLEYNVLNSPQMRFRLASLTKSFTATAIMILQERGKLKIEDSICKFIENCPASWTQVTIKQLLNHTSGITEFSKQQPTDDSYRRTPMTKAATLERAKQFSPDFLPGEKFAYSSIGYVLLGHIIEKASRGNYEDFLRENIFVPLGMKNTGIDRQQEIIKNRAEGYRRADDGNLLNFEFYNLDYLFAAGNLYSTTEDLYLLAKSFDDEKLLKKETLQQVFTAGLENTGLGWEIFEKNNRRFIRSSGSSFGFSNSLTWFPKEKVTIILLGNINTAAASKNSEAITEIIFADNHK